MTVFYIITAVLFASLMATELILANKRKWLLHNKQDSLTSLFFGVLGVVSRILVKGTVIITYWWVYEYRIVDFGPDVNQLWWVWTLCFFANDFIYYWFHRWSHTVRFLWCTHVNHHSSEYMNFFTAARTPFLNWVHHWIFWLPLPLLGFPPEMILIIESIGFLFAFIQHTQIIPKLGPIEWVVNTPSHHRVHHGSNPQYIDKNYGNTLIIFDRIFGTFEPEEEEVKYGITKNIKTYNLVKVALHEWDAMFRDVRNARNWRERFMYLFGGPGWKPEDLREAEAGQNLAEIHGPENSTVRISHGGEFGDR